MWLAQQLTQDPVSYSPLAIVATVVGFLLWRMKDSDADSRKRLVDLETRVESKESEIQHQRSLKHEALNKLSAAQGTLQLVSRLNKQCTCGALAPIQTLLPKSEGD